MSALPPGSVIGILGGGQLARMLALAAAPLGLKCHIFAPEIDSPAFQVSASHMVAQYTDESALLEFAAEVDVVTYEFENVPVAAVEFLEKLKPVRPGSKALAVAQDRLKEKWLARDMGAMTADFTSVGSLEELRKRAGPMIEYPSILKTTRLGYDGKGQAKLHSDVDIETAWAVMKNQPAILEGFVHFDREISVICARGVDGSFAAYEPTENVHRNHILHTSTVPAVLDVELAIEAVYLAQRMADTLEYVGVMGIEFFVGRNSLYVNEIAPRVHNSGHWTQDACVVSQFEQHIRAVAGWPLGATFRHSDVVMTNLLGDEAGAWEKLANQPNVGLHLYGKAESRPGRKMGHYNRITPRQG
jgi:5-(carboxyamino)imidazole ribonucleotide synthase